MAKDVFYTAIDIGTSKISTLVARVGQEGELKIVGAGYVPSQGVNRGRIVNMAEIQEALQASLSEAQKYLGGQLPPAFVGVTGDNITCVNTTGTTQALNPSGSISASDVNHVLELSVPRPAEDKEILHLYPRNFIIDGNQSVRDAIGLHATKLEVESHVVLSDKSSVEDIKRAVESCGVPVRGVALNALAASEAVLTEGEKEVGVVLIDIGAGITDVAVFRNGNLWYNTCLPVGGRLVSRDLSIALSIPFHYAEELKLKWGHAMLGPKDGDEEILMPSFQGRPKAMVKRSMACRPISERLQETLGLVMMKVQQAGMTRMPPGGVVITGGTAEMAGIEQLAKFLYSCPVRIAGPTSVPGLSADEKKPPYSVVVGLLLWGINHLNEKKHKAGAEKSPGQQGSLFQRIKKVIEAK
ncbi:MAG: cell division protein FtsA [SAR202 cluster bacterium]|nr:cell division protein FtsA [SAR202 cluster bacterium]